MLSIEIDRIQRAVPMSPRFERWLDPRAPIARGEGYEVQVHSGRHQGVAHVRAISAARTLLAIRVDGGKRVELEVPCGQRAFLVIVSGAGRIDGDDTVVRTDDIVWFKSVDGEEPVLLGLEAEVGLRALLYSEASLE